MRPLVNSLTLTGSPLTLSTSTSRFLHDCMKIRAASWHLLRACRHCDVYTLPHSTQASKESSGTVLDEGVLSLR